MEVLFTYPRELFDKGKLNRRMITKLIEKHRALVRDRLQVNLDYYEGKHTILDRTRESGAPNHKPVCNHAKDITDTASGYFMGSPIAYTADEKGKALLDAFDKANSDDADQDNALQISIYGRSYEYIYAAEERVELAIQSLNPRNTFLVHDDSIERRELFGVYYDVKRDDINDRTKYVATVCTDAHIYEFILFPSDGTKFPIDGAKEPMPHNLGYVPIVEYKNNKFCIGDYEQQIGLIDAYNTLMADRVNDKEQFIDAVLVIYGAILGDTDAETTEALKKLKKDKLLELPLDAKADYLARTFDETSVETLRKAIKEDIYMLSHVPNLTDENFAGNSSGVAMEYKLLGLEMLTKVKERYYRKGLKKRIMIFCHFLNIKAVELDPESIVPTFSRALPKNLMELAQIVSMLSEDISTRTRIKLLPFVEDPDAEVEAVEEEKEKAAQRQQEAFKAAENEPPQEDDEE